MPRQRRRPITNPALQTAIQTTSLTCVGLAKAINTVAGESGRALYYDASTVAHWLTGVTPRPEMIPIIVETCASLLGQPALTAHDLGWSHAEPTKPDDPWDGDPVAWLTRLGRDDMLDRRSLLKGGLYSLAALNLPPQPESAPTGRAAPVTPAPATSFGSRR